jgi:phosphoglycolate phosphatase
MPRTYKLVIFDFDGTLADSAAWMMGVLNDIAATHGFRQVTDAEIEILRGRGTREIMSALGVKPWKLPAIARDMRKRSAEAAASIPLFPGVAEMLRRLADAGVITAVVSSNGEDVVRKVLGPAANVVGHYSCGASLFGKAAKFSALVRKLRVDPHAVLCVGDESRDVEGAREAGLAAAAVTWGYAREEALTAAAPDFIYRSVAELTESVLE